jgi:hypothetical protein
MGWDFAEETVRVLTSGVPPAPQVPSPGVTFAAACHRGDRFGVVLFLRLWRNGQWDSDTAITERTEDGWDYPSACGGGGWLDPYERPAAGWDGEAIAILGSSQVGSETEDGVFDGATAVEGLASPDVAAIDYRLRETTWRYAIDSPVGAFVIVVEGEIEPMLRAVDRGGRHLGDWRE